MIAIYAADPETGIKIIDLDTLRQIMASKQSDSPLIWTDLEAPTSQEEQLILAEIYKFHQLTILDCRRERLNPDRGDHLPKVEDYGRYLFSIVNPIELASPDASDDLENTEIRTTQINTYLGERFIVTHHYEPSVAIAKTLSMCSRNPRYLERGPDYIYHLILDDIVDELNPILDRFDEHIDQLEDEIFTARANGTVLAKILNMKRQVFSLRRITTYQRELVYRLSRGEFPLITQEEIAYYRNVYDHLVRASEMAESYRDVLTGLLDAYLSMSSNRLNEVMKVLAIISTFFLPLTFVAGVYGMNFDPDSSPWNMPELRWVYGYPAAIGLMVLMAIFMFIFFKKKRWL